MSQVLNLPPEAQKSFMKMQMFQQQIQSINMQKETLNFQKIEAERALEELDKMKDNDEVFKAVGPILIKTNKSSMEKEIKEKVETADVRLKSLETQEKKIKTEVEEVQKKLEEILKPADEEKTTAG